MDKKTFVSKINKVKRLYEKAQAAESLLFIELAEAFPKVDFAFVDTGAENADNVTQAMSCYYLYGEYKPENIWTEIEDAVRELNS